MQAIVSRRPALLLAGTLLAGALVAAASAATIVGTAKNDVLAWFPVAAEGKATASAGAAAGVRCKLAGTHYVGATARGDALCFTLSRDATAIREFSFRFRYKASCAGIATSGTFVVAARLAVVPGGTFRMRSGATVVSKELDWSGTSLVVTARPAVRATSGTTEITGRLTGSEKATGTVRLKLQLAEAIDKKTGKQTPVYCDTGRIGWTSSKAA